MRELWEKNATQRDMLRILNEEGYDIKERELMRVRAKNRWLLRVPNGTKMVGRNEKDAESPSEPQIEGATADSLDQTAAAAGSPATATPLAPQVEAKRKERLDQMQAESDQRWQEKRRRRRTRGWAGLPADPPGPPRFPSETTLDESKSYLSLNGTMYREVREHFQQICNDSDITKKTLAGPERWQRAKDRLIAENAHLQQVLWIDNAASETKALALDVVCTDVTKRMRTLERRMTIADAKNTLGINPEESRQMRNAFYSVLKADHFTSKLEAGDDHWMELKEQWMQNQPRLLGILAPGEADPHHAAKVKAVEVLCRDVMKRLRDDQTKHHPAKKEQEEAEASMSTTSANRISSQATRGGGYHISSGISTLASEALASTPLMGSTITEMQIDPSLLQAANDPTFAADDSTLSAPQTSYMGATGEENAEIPAAAAAPVAVYLRAHSNSQVYRNSKVWLGTLSTRSVAELRGLLASRWPNASIERVDGVEKVAGGQEICYLIEEDDELDAYLTHVHERKATFVALMKEQ